jgi:hypothetical protein
MQVSHGAQVKSVVPAQVPERNVLPDWHWVAVRQGLQTVFAVAVQAETWYSEPAVHELQGSQRPPATAVLRKKPEPQRQLVKPAELAGLVDCSGHARQVTGVVLLPPAVAYWLAGQPLGLQTVLPGLAEKVLGPQGVQGKVPEEENVPAGQRADVTVMVTVAVARSWGEPLSLATTLSEYEDVTSASRSARVTMAPSGLTTKGRVASGAQVVGATVVGGLKQVALVTLMAGVAAAQVVRAGLKVCEGVGAADEEHAWLNEYGAKSPATKAAGCLVL